MEMMDALKRMLHEAVLPELGAIRAENAEIKSILQLTNKRIDDIQTQLVDQSRRIDETNKRIDQLHSDLLRRIDETNRSIARLYEVIVRRDEYQLILERVGRLERGLEDLRARVAA